jgi:hypothetical protein
MLRWEAEIAAAPPEFDVVAAAEAILWRAT